MENMTAMFLHGVTSMERHGQSLAQTLKLPETGHDLLTKWPGGPFFTLPPFWSEKGQNSKIWKNTIFLIFRDFFKNLEIFHFVARDIMKHFSMFCNRVA